MPTDSQDFDAEDLLPAVYDELRALARSRLRNEHPGATLQATMLVHEAYLRIQQDGKQASVWNSKGHFFGAASQAMRRILVEQARRKARLRHGGALERQDIDADAIPIQPPAAPEELLAVDEAVRKLEHEDPRKGQIVNLRYFAGLTNAETAAALEVSVGTIEREWRFIRAWLQSELE